MSNDATGVIWDDNNEVSTHTSGMMYDPKRNYYYTLVTEDPHDLRLALTGKLGINNKLVLNEHGWTWSFFKNADPLDLLDLFGIQSLDNELSLMQ